jgi:hypothetical protein
VPVRREIAIGKNTNALERISAIAKNSKIGRYPAATEDIIDFSYGPAGNRNRRALGQQTGYRKHTKDHFEGLWGIIVHRTKKRAGKQPHSVCLAYDI